MARVSSTSATRPANKNAARARVASRARPAFADAYSKLSASRRMLVADLLDHVARRVVRRLKQRD